MNIRNFLTVAVAISAGLLAAVEARAQFGTVAGYQTGQFGNGTTVNGGTTTNGAFGSRTLGGTLSPTGSTFSGGAVGGMQGASGSIPQGNGPLGGFANLDSIGTGEYRMAQQQFIGANPNNGFIGAVSQTPGGGGARTGQNTMGLAGRGMNGGLAGGLGNQMLGQMFGQQFGRQNQNGRGNLGNNGFNRQQSRSAVKVSYTSAMPSRPAAPAAVADRLSNALSSISSSGPIQVQMQGETAILRGVVATDHQRALAAKVALLRPGVSQIRNELVVAPEDTLLAPQ
jgi:hypothetical protein